MSPVQTDDLAVRVQRTADLLRAAVTARAIFITADERIGEADAADLTGYAVATLKNLRALGVGPIYFSRAAGPGGKVSYRLDDLARWIERARANEDGI